MDSVLEQDVARVVKAALDEATEIWAAVGDQMIKFSALEARHVLVSRIPGHQYVVDGEPKIDDFIAIATDLRDSTKHLLQLTSAKAGIPSRMERLLYETSALLPATARIVDWHDGRATEYPGDGVLGLFRVNHDDESGAVYAAYAASNDIHDAVARIINPQLEARFNLPPIHVGVGMAYGRAIVTAVGYDRFRQPKAIGRCVYCACKLSKEPDVTLIDGPLKELWPKREGGPLRFLRWTGSSDFEAFEIERETQPQ